MGIIKLPYASLTFVLLGAAAPLSAQSATEVVLHNFGRSEGAEPGSGVIRDSAGNVYGVASEGGSQYGGVLFEVDTAGTYKVLHVFNRDANGWSPNAVIRDDQGNFYGTTAYGGSTAQTCVTFGCGLVYKLDAAGQYTILHNFMSGTDGADPGCRRAAWCRHSSGALAQGEKFRIADFRLPVAVAASPETQ
jgi:uncharacterized repeat protein (TIGR03803 family)